MVCPLFFRAVTVLLFVVATQTGCVAAQNILVNDQSNRGDVWYRYLPPQAIRGSVHFYVNPVSNDVCVAYPRGRFINVEAYGRSEYAYGALLFFGGEHIPEASVPPAQCPGYAGDALGSSKLKLLDGNTISVESLDLRVSGACPRDHAQYLRLKNKDGQVLAEKTFIYRLPIPTKAKIVGCQNWEGTYDRVFTTLADSLYQIPGDPTVLLAGYRIEDAADIVLRIKPDLSFPRMCEVKNLLIVDTGDARWLQGQHVGDPEADYPALQTAMQELFERKRRELCP